MNRKQRRAAGDKTAKPDVQAALSKAMQLLRLGKHADAEKVYREVVRVAPDNQGALFNLGLLAHHRGAVDEAVTIFEKLVRIAPTDADAAVSLAILRAEQGNTAEALTLAERGLQLKPSATGLVQLGVLFSEIGETEKARGCLGAALQLQPHNMQAYVSLHKLKKFSANDPDFMRLLEIEKRASGLTNEDRARLSFVLAKAYMDQGDAEKSFGHLSTANGLKKKAYAGYDIARHEQEIGKVMRLFDAAGIARLRPAVQDLSTRPVFIVGMPRCGSTLTEQILASHPDAASIGESRAFSQALPRMELEKFDAAAIEGVGRKYISSTGAAAKTAKRLTDKMLYNYMWIGVIRLALPNAKIIHCTRDPIDTGLSIWEQTFSDPVPWAYDQRDIGRYYLAYKKLMDHWNDVFPNEIHEVNYETLVADQAGETRRLLEFCGLPWDERCLAFHQNDRQVKTSSLAQVRRPLYKDSVKKWEKHAQHLSLLIETIKGAP